MSSELLRNLIRNQVRSCVSEQRGYYKGREAKKLAKLKTFGTPGFVEEFYRQANRIGAKPTDLATIIDKESGYTWSPEVRPYDPKTKKYLSSAQGLIQFIRRTRRALEKRMGRNFPKKKPAEQMKFVGDYFDMVKSEHPDADYSNIVDLYLAVFHPNALGKSPGYVVGSERRDDYATQAALVNKGYIDKRMSEKDLERLPGRELGNVARRDKGLPEIDLPVITRRSIANKVKRWKKFPMADSLDPADWGAADAPLLPDDSATQIAEDKVMLKDFIREMVTTYALGRIDAWNGGAGEMFKLGVDYKTAATNLSLIHI